MGFSVAKAQCLVAPPYAAAALVMFVQAIFADKWRIRGPVVAFNAAMGLVGLALMGYLESPAPRYFGIFLATIAGEFSSSSSSGVLFYAVRNFGFIIETDRMIPTRKRKLPGTGILAKVITSHYSKLYLRS